MKTILITGGTGFLGRHLVAQLRQAEPTARLRILCRGASPWDRAATAADVELVRGNITAKEDVFRAAAGGASANSENRGWNRTRAA